MLNLLKRDDGFLKAPPSVPNAQQRRQRAADIQAFIETGMNLKPSDFDRALRELLPLQYPGKVHTYCQRLKRYFSR
ncbi:MAG: hypothetical protein AAF412_12310 [Pseudomonadota bacterium]